MIRQRVRDRLLDRVVSSAVPLDVSKLVGRTVVLAPHPDDETLGAGGLIALLRGQGEPVSIVFMTDGSGSHAGSRVGELTELRRSEAVAAAAHLGVAASDLHFLDQPDGRLSGVADAAARQLVTVFDELEPARIVLPHAFEPNDDHSATFRIADAAARRRGDPIDALTYIVWFWDQWPWTKPRSDPRGRHGRRARVDMARRGAMGLGFERLLTHLVDIRTVADRKRAALAAHASQMTRPVGRAEWMTLADVAEGDWLDLLMQPHELFAMTRLAVESDR